MLYIRLTPKGARDEIGGLATLADGRCLLKARVRAAPENGEANEALLRLLAKTLRIPLSEIRLQSGASGRMKTLCFKSAQGLVPKLEGLCREP